ncbi:restriction endonuclease subunit S [Acinetobacter amyesii]|uniref:restriction endonuclease subunit S n=1 Tax=Acinetobacter amyesii TaxID=2942470 RepID=UPI0020BF5DB9|nr:restriction endonuclease subunit S [Acinetobacter amyesii]MCL6230451.1 restriction endonuclease subunit S [Acinetobacter amyesii]
MINKYDAYKDSGIDWVGKIPAHWNVLKLGGIFEQRNQKVSDKDYPALSVTKNGIVPQLDNAAKTKDGDNRKLVLKGDFVINSRSDRKGSSGLSSLDGSVSLINIVLKPRKIEPKFSHHLMKCNAFIEEYYRVGRGIVADLWTTRFEEMKTMNLALPSVKEQRQIADFLDQRLVEIDQAIAIKEQQIALLNERKQIVIQKAVTQGLNPNVALKDSGVEWIGEIPEHWITKKFKYAMSIKARLGWKGLKADEYVDNSEYGFLSTPNIKHQNIKYDECYFITQRRYEESPEIMLEDGDILLVKDGSTLGISNIVKNLPFKCTVNSSIAVLRKFQKEQYLPSFLNYYLKTSSIQNHIKLVKDGMGVPHLFQSDIKNFVLIIPPIIEQEQIIEFIEYEVEKIDTGISLIEDQIQKMKEYKTTLINDAVTGKIKVA